jgi:hypothetical protein
MGWLLPTVYLKWHEPKDVTLAREEIAERARPWWFKPIMVVILAALMMFIWWVAQFNPNNVNRPNFDTALATALGFPLFLIYVFPRMILWSFVRFKFAKAKVKVIDKMIIYSGIGGHPVQFRSKDVAQCRIIAGGNGSPTLLVVEFRKGKSCILGVAPEVSPENLDRVLRDRCGLQVVVDDDRNSVISGRPEDVPAPDA